ncbi:MAG: LysM peptidoglycan-binding domain-containing protein [Chloroflexota bacterium]
MDRICPYLALADDGRTVADGFDPEHRCHALTPPAPLERSRQVQLCLTEAHARCERFGAARTAWLAASSGLPRVAPDVAFGRTRLVLEPEAAWRSLASSPTTRFSRPAILVAAVALAVVALLVLSSIVGILNGPPATTSQTASPSPSPSASPFASSQSASAEASASASAPAPSTTPVATPVPTQRTYTVQQGDTLNLIAQRFGTTAEAIRAANGLTGDTINVGQTLIIP